MLFHSMDWYSNVVPLRASTLLDGFIRAESAVIGLRIGCRGAAMSIMTTLFCGDVSRTHIYLSESIVTCVNVMNCWLIPMLVSCKTQSHGSAFGNMTICK